MARRVLPVLKNATARLPEFLLGLAILGTAGAPLEIWSSHVERMSHFRLWWLGLLLMLALWYLHRRRWVPGRIAIVGAAWAFVPLLPYWYATSPASTSSKEAPLKVIAWNVLWSNERKPEALAWLDSQNADLILLTECTTDWRAALAPLTASYPHQLSSARDGAEGMWLLSRYPLEAPDPEGLGANKPWLATVIHSPAGPIRFLGMHPRTPRAGARFDERNAQFEKAAGISAQATASGMPVLLMGDLNCTPFSPWFSRLLGRGALRDSAIGFGLTGTWTGQGVRLPIDHVLVNRRLRVLDYHVEGDWHGSDHRPVTASLAVQVTP